MNRKQFTPSLVLALVVALGAQSCATTSSATPAPRPAPAPAASAPADVYPGTARNPSLLAAQNGAKMDAVRKAVESILGKAKADAQAALLDQVLYSTRNPNQYVFPDTMETLRKDNVAPAGAPFEYLYELRIKVNRQAIENTLSANGLLGGATTPVAANPAPAATTPGAPPATPAQTAPPARGGDLDLTPQDLAGVTPAQQAFIRRYVDQLTFMVYINDASVEDPNLLKAGVTQANSWLAEQGYTLVDVAQIEKLKAEGRAVYQAETGGSMSVTQWIAQSQNADVYLELDASLSATSSGRSHLGKANLTIKIIEPSTGQLLGSTPYSHPGQVSLTDQYDAKFQAMASSVWQALPVAVNQARNLLAKQLTRGVRFEVVLQKTTDRRTTLDFINKLKVAENVKDVKSMPSGRDESRFEVFYFGSGDDLELQIYDTASLVSGLNNIDWVSSRGKLLTFTSGL